MRVHREVRRRPTVGIEHRDDRVAAAVLSKGFSIACTGSGPHGIGGEQHPERIRRGCVAQPIAQVEVLRHERSYRALGLETFQTFAQAGEAINSVHHGGMTNSRPIRASTRM